MSIELPTISLSAGVQTAISFPGNLGSIAYIKIANASPYLVSLTNLGSGQDAMQPGEVNVWPMTGVTGNVGVNPQVFLSGVTGPSSALVVVIYLANENPPSGNYPLFTNLLSYVGNTVSTTTIGVLQNDGAAAGTTIIESTNASSAQSNVLVKNDGTFTLYGNTQAGPATPGKLFSVAPATALANANINAYATMAVADLSVLGVFSSDNGVIQSDGAGGLTVKTLTAQAPVTLLSGHQETGQYDLTGTETAGAFRGYGQNFKTVMTNVPSSVTLTVGASSNITSMGVTSVTKYGFCAQYQATAAAFTAWHGTYTTVGNCLLTVDTAARTLDHHCDACGAVHRGVPFSTLFVGAGAWSGRLSIACSCGAEEYLTTTLTSADAADPTPQGSGDYLTTRGAQATLIRQLMTALGLAVAP